ALTGILLLFSCQSTKQEKTADLGKPNILFLFADDQRAGTINAHGNDEIITPNIDKLADVGVSFTNTYIMGGSSGAVCAPSRAMLMTGRHLYGIEKQDWKADISEKNKTLPEVFKDAGYETFATGKQHNGRSAFARGFSDGDEIFFGGMSDPWNVPVYHFDSTGKYDKKIPYIKDWAKTNHPDYIRNCDHIIRGKHSSELFADAVIDFLKRHDKRKPFFAYVSYTAPHDPRSMPQEYLNMYDTAAITLPPNYLPQHPFDFGEFKIRDEVLAGFPRTKSEVKTHLRDYYAMITHMDSQIGRIIQALKESGEYENTIIVFSADNGLAVGQHGLMGKQNVYEHSIGVPLIICGPGIPENEKRNAFCYLFDIFPTLCELTEMEIPETVQGKSFAGAIADKETKHRETMVYGYKEYQRAYRKGDFKLIEYFVDGERNTQLFNLKDDPIEFNNLFGDEKFDLKYAELKEEMIQQMKVMNDTNLFYKEMIIN
ncbi:MAG: sulfatase-like hydrolase/transferase, partial [Bacteroidales bacterium]|nr:sulfatase-like hydrolase/transferase [Bacteroidales bacterium]